MLLKIGVKLMKIALCDDEQQYIDHFLRLLRSIDSFSNAQIDGYISSSSLLEAMPEQKYDIVFLDIDMPGINGIELGKQICTNFPQTIIIFVTNHEKYAIDAFDCDACGYLLKNCDEKRFSGTIEKVLKRYKALNKNIFLDTKTKIVAIPIDNILHIEYAGRRCHYYTISGIYTIRRSMNTALTELEEFGFIKIHQYRIVNLAKIRVIHKSSIQLVDNSVIELSRYRHNEVVQKYIKFRKEKL